MESQGIISKFDGCDVSPEWLNSFVIVKKASGALCICLDLTDFRPGIQTFNSNAYSVWHLHLKHISNGPQQCNRPI